jgi:hypothetical protein
VSGIWFYWMPFFLFDTCSFYVDFLFINNWITINYAKSKA